MASRFNSKYDGEHRSHALSCRERLGRGGGGTNTSITNRHADRQTHRQSTSRRFVLWWCAIAAWQLGNEFQSKWATKEEQAGVLQYGLDFLKQLEPVYTAPETKNGECAEVRECIAHQKHSLSSFDTTAPRDSNSVCHLAH